jgi:PrtD family type I secretion system ABC transporter
MTSKSATTPIGDIRKAIGLLRGAFVAIGAFSAVVSVLYLTSSIYMIQVYDRVLMSGSVPTLVALSVLALALYGMHGLLEAIRGRLLVRIGGRLDDMLAERVYRAFLALPFKGGKTEDGLQPVRDLDSARTFIAGMGPVAILDMPWMPLFLGFIFILHPVLGWFALGGGAVLVCMTLLTEKLTHAPTRKASGTSARRFGLAEMTRRNAEVVRVMGMTDRMARRWLSTNEEHKKVQHDVTDLTVVLSSASKMLRLVLQSGILGLAAWLVIRGELSAGAMFAANIAMTRALAPIETAIANWKSFIMFRESKARLEKLLASFPEDAEPMPLPPPARELTVEGLYVGPPGVPKPFVQNASLKLSAGQGLGIIGPSASGKSTLVRGIVGAWPALRGEVRLDGAAMEQWSSTELGVHVGYLPQDVELLDGTIAENIARFADNPSPAAVIKAATIAGIHEMILMMPDGYDTVIGPGGYMPSGGQRQRIGLARAVFGDPFLLVLDEPNSNLDNEGEEALAKALSQVRARGGIVVIVAHRPSALGAVDMVAMMSEGQIRHFGPRDEVLAKVLQPPRARNVEILRQGGTS